MFITLCDVLRHKALYGMGDGNAREGSCMLSSFYFPLISFVLLCSLWSVTPYLLLLSSASVPPLVVGFLYALLLAFVLFLHRQFSGVA